MTASREGHAAFLAEVSQLLASSLELSTTLERVVHLALPVFADWSALDLLEEDGRVNRIAAAHALPSKEELIGRLKARFTPDLRGSPGISRVLTTGKTEFYPEVDEALLGQIGRDEEHRRVLEALGTDSILIVPLVARDRLFGSLAFVLGDSGRRFTQSDVTLAEDLGARAALALDNAYLYLQAQEAVRARDEFLGVASHELHTPVTSLQLAVQALLRLARGQGLASAPKEIVEATLVTSERQVVRLTGLIERLFDAVRFQAGQVKLELVELDLAAMLRDLAAGLSIQFEQAGCELALDVPHSLVGLWDRMRLEQIVVNLLTNALKYGEGRPVRLSLTKFEKAQAGGGRPHARIEVRDHGMGISPEAQTRIFHRFERAVSSRNYSGLGLGLYIVERAVHSLGGTVRVESREGEGANFIVELPIVLRGGG